MSKGLAKKKKIRGVDSRQRIGYDNVITMQTYAQGEVGDY